MSLLALVAWCFLALACMIGRFVSSVVLISSLCLVFSLMALLLRVLSGLKFNRSAIGREGRA